MTRLDISGRYQAHRSGHASRNWSTVVQHHEQDFPGVRSCQPGTFNVVGKDLPAGFPPQDARLRDLARRHRGQVGDGNHISPFAKAVAMNGQPITAWIYRGAQDKGLLEFISELHLQQHLGVVDGDAVTITFEITTEALHGMPSPPGTWP